MFTGKVESAHLDQVEQDRAFRAVPTRAHKREIDGEHPNDCQKQQGRNDRVLRHVVQPVRQKERAEDKESKHREKLPDTFHECADKVDIVLIGIAENHACDKGCDEPVAANQPGSDMGRKRDHKEVRAARILGHQIARLGQHRSA